MYKRVSLFETFAARESKASLTFYESHISSGKKANRWCLLALVPLPALFTLSQAARWAWNVFLPLPLPPHLAFSPPHSPSLSRGYRRENVRRRGKFANSCPGLQFSWITRSASFIKLSLFREFNSHESFVKLSQPYCHLSIDHCRGPENF